MILLSVVVANRNNAPWLARCLDSILDQTLKNCEIVVVDDASSDDSPAIIRKRMSRYPERVRGFFLKRRQGPARARDFGIRNAAGTFLSTLDGDDYLIHPQKLEKELELAQIPSGNGRKTAGFSGIIRVDDAGEPVKAGSHFAIMEGRITEELLGRTCYIPRDFTFFRELYFLAGGFDRRYPIYEDWDFKLRLSTLVDFCYTGMDGVAYRRHGTGLSAAPIPMHLQWQRRVFRKNRHLVAAPARRRALSALTVEWDNMRRRFLHQYIRGNASFRRAWHYWAVLKARRLQAPAWKHMLRRSLDSLLDSRQQQ